MLVWYYTRVTLKSDKTSFIWHCSTYNLLSNTTLSLFDPLCKQLNINTTL